jgi:hypothetical protein
MDKVDNGLTLQSLAHRLEALERENERMCSENVELRDEVAQLRGSGTSRDEVAVMSGSQTSQAVEPAPAFEGRVSRRSLLSKAGAAAVAAVAAGTLLSPREAKATHYADAISVDGVNTHYVDAFINGLQPALRGHNDGTGNGVRALSKGGEGVYSLGVIGVFGESFTDGKAAVYGKRFDGLDPDSNGPGVVGEGRGSSYAGVFGRNPTGTGVWGQSFETGYSGVYGQHSGSLGYGIVGDGKGEAGAGVLGRNNDGTGVHGTSSKTGYGGVTAEHTGTAGFGVIGLGKGTTGAGVLGRNSAGYGGQFEGGKAQLRIVPKGSVGKPTSGAHAKGEVYMDSAGTLFVCTANGTPGTWRKVQTVAA